MGSDVVLTTGSVILEWAFKPADAFEQSIEIEETHYKLTIENGKVVARIDAATFDADPAIRQRLHDSLNDRLLGMQLQSHRPYELSQSSMVRKEDGKRTVYAGALISVELGFRCDIQVRDAAGNIVHDSRKQRINEQLRLGELVQKQRAKDPLADALLASYKAAVDDPDNELVHLYEIRDALKTKFRNERAVRSHIGITPAEWSRFGLLANKAPLRQGRHRGTNAGGLRDATEDELKEARSIARKMIEGYLVTLP